MTTGLLNTPEYKEVPEDLIADHRVQQRALLFREEIKRN